MLGWSLAGRFQFRSGSLPAGSSEEEEVISCPSSSSPNRESSLLPDGWRSLWTGEEGRMGEAEGNTGSQHKIFNEVNAHRKTQIKAIKTVQ